MDIMDITMDITGIMDHVMDHVPASDSRPSRARSDLQPDTIGFQECDSPELLKSRIGLEVASKFAGAQGIMVKPGTFKASWSPKQRPKSWEYIQIYMGICRYM